MIATSMGSMRFDAQPFRVLFRVISYKLRPPHIIPYHPTIRRAQDTVIATGRGAPYQAATILHEQRKGPTPTIVLGGFVPDATEQVFLMRGFLLKHGSIYYINYSRQGFSSDLLFAQLDDLVEELSRLHGQRPVIFSVSFGAGLIMEWLKRACCADRCSDLTGLILISPVACVHDLLVPGEDKPSTLLGRAMKPFMESQARDNAYIVEKSRAVFTKMFELGAQNQAALLTLMTRAELTYLHSTIIGTIRAIDATGASERVQALKQFEDPSSYLRQSKLPLSSTPTLILYAEKESSVITDQSPTRFALESARRAYFPNSQLKVITNHRGSPVQHASLIFHCFNFRSAISQYYRHLKQCTPQEIV